MASNQTSGAGAGGGIPGNFSAGPPDLPPNPFGTPEQIALLPHDNAGMKLLSSIWPLIALAAVFLGLRIYCKVSRHNRLWWDDYLLIASWVAIVIESILLTHAVVNWKYGAHAWDYPFFDLVSLIPITASAGVFSICGAIWSKTSFAVTLLRLTDGWMKWVLWFIIISMNLAMGISAVLPFVMCTPVQKSWTPTMIEGSCLDFKILIDYDIFSAVYSATMDLALALLPWTLVWKLQMKPTEKIGVAVAMSMGVFAAITALIKTSKIPSGLGMDMYDGIDLFIWGIAESAVTIVAASIPILRVLVREARTTARRYYVSKDGASSGSGLRSKAGRTQNNTVVISSGNLASADRQANISKIQDDSSDKSILSDGPYRASGTGNGRIVRTKEVNVAYQSRKDTDSDDFEMQPV